MYTHLELLERHEHFHALELYQRAIRAERERAIEPLQRVLHHPPLLECLEFRSTHPSALRDRKRGEGGEGGERGLSRRRPMRYLRSTVGIESDDRGGPMRDLSSTTRWTREGGRSVEMTWRMKKGRV